ncbi:MAG: hypothetical protein LYZ69_01190 [Nitrososphaerales archaeon]|nr:hypothetical protein [Nitrososphaerales archaeon]
MHASRGKVADRLLKPALALWLVASLAVPGAIAAARPSANGAGTSGEAGYSGTPWGLGVVVPDGAGLSGGDALSWSAATNVTVVVRIPDIVNATQIMYAILSLMTRDGSVLQVAAGIYPGNRSWLVYSMFIADVGTYPQRYQWVLNSSEPRMSPGDSVAIAIILTQTDGWMFIVRDLSTGSSVERSFGANAAHSLKVGDQEVFALESYSRDASTFEKMGNLTLVSILVDGMRVSNGWYPYADWDVRHNPLFVVGGATPPQFIAFSRGGNVTAVWYYVEGWSGSWQPAQLDLFVSAALIAAAGCVMLVARWYVGRAGALKRFSTVNCAELPATVHFIGLKALSLLVVSGCSDLAFRIPGRAQFPELIRPVAFFNHEKRILTF